MAPDRDSWLSITPEPEGELPEALATLRAGGTPAPAEVKAERERAERLITRARRRAYQRWLAEARGLATGDRPSDPATERAARVAKDVLDNHDALELGITSREGSRRQGR